MHVRTPRRPPSLLCVDLRPSERELLLKYCSSRLSKRPWCPWPAPEGSAAAARGPLKACTERLMGAPSAAMYSALQGNASRLLLLLRRWPGAGTQAGAPLVRLLKTSDSVLRGRSQCQSAGQEPGVPVLWAFPMRLGAVYRAAGGLSCEVGKGEHC